MNSGNSDAYLIKIASASGQLMSKTPIFVTAGDDRATGIFIDTTSNKAFICGYTNGNGPTKFGTCGDYDMFIAKMTVGNVTPSLDWSIQYGSAKYDQATSILSNGTNRIWVGGITTNSPATYGVDGTIIQIANAGLIAPVATDISSATISTRGTDYIRCLGLDTANAYVCAFGDTDGNLTLPAAVANVNGERRLFGQQFSYAAAVTSTNPALMDAFPPSGQDRVNGVGKDVSGAFNLAGTRTTGAANQTILRRVTSISTNLSLSPTNWTSGNGELGTGIVYDADSTFLYTTGRQILAGGNSEVIIRQFTLATLAPSVATWPILISGNGFDQGMDITVTPSPVGISPISLYITGSTRSTDFDGLSQTGGQEKTFAIRVDKNGNKY